MVIGYLGNFDVHRGLEQVIKCVVELSKKYNIKLLLVGQGKNEAKLRKMSNDNIVFEVWQRPEMLSEYIGLMDVGIVPHLKNRQTDRTISHKLFQYLLMKKPVIVSNCKPLKRIVENANCGLVFRNKNELKKRILQLYESETLCAMFGENGKRAVYNYYNWKTSEKKLLKLYSQIK